MAVGLPEKIALIGGAGKLGMALARRWAAAGLPVLIGSRDPGRARECAKKIDPDGSFGVRGVSNFDAASIANVVVLTVPYAAHDETIKSLHEALRRKVVIDTTVPLVPPKVSEVQLPVGHSAELRTQAILTESRVVAAFHHVSATKLAQGFDAIDSDVLVCGDDREACEFVLSLADKAGLRGRLAGSLANAIALESLTPVLIWMNRHYRVPGAGVCIVGLDEPKARPVPAGSARNQVE